MLTQGLLKTFSLCADEVRKASVEVQNHSAEYGTISSVVGVFNGHVILAGCAKRKVSVMNDTMRNRK